MNRSLFSLVILLTLLLLSAFTFQNRSILRADGFAEDRFPAPPKGVKIDPERCMKYLRAICDLGPRISGTKGMKKQQVLLAKHMKAQGAEVEWQVFTARQRSRAKPVEMANLIAKWHPRRKRRVVLCAHYDTRPIADQEPNPRNWHKPFLGANDGGSGVALLMELAHHIKKLDLKVGVDFVLFDGEEFIFEQRKDKYFYGSEHFADKYRARKRKDQGYISGILFDMVAGKNATFPVEQNSWWMAGQLVQQVWKVAATQQCRAFKINRMSRIAVQDDHLALNRVGIPTIDIIDFDYPHWHRLSDTPDNCSGDTMAQVGRTVLAWLPQVR